MPWKEEAMNYDLIVIGAGPAGYVAAIKAGQSGLKTLVIDKQYIGGMCLNWGCIPSKALLESAKNYHRVKSLGDFGVTGIDVDKLGFDWQHALKRSSGVISKLSRGIEYLWKKNGVEYLKAEAKIISPTEVEADNRIFQTKNIIIATGSRPAQLKDMPQAIGIEALYKLPELPQKPIIYGGGAIAFEMAQFFSLLDRKPMIIATRDPLIPDLDDYLNAFVQKKLKKDKITVLRAEEIKTDNTMIMHSGTELDFDAVINCSWRDAILPESNTKIVTHNGYIATDTEYRTNHANIFAAGDVNGKSYLAHAASAQAVRIIDIINGRASIDENHQYPLNIYSDPEIAQLGLTEKELKAKGIEYKISEFPFSANGKALAEGTSEGFIRLIYETNYSQVLGVQIVAPNATDLIAEAGVLMELEGTVYDLARTVHAHPTVAEVFMDAGSVFE